MAERRPLASAMELSSEKLAFIQPTPNSKPAPAPVAPEVRPLEEEVRPTEEAGPTSLVKAAERSRPSRRRAERAEQVSGLVGGLLAPITTRLQPNTADALRRATLEQRLKRLRPATQQEIVELAVRDWLERNGYLDSN